MFVVFCSFAFDVKIYIDLGFEASQKRKKSDAEQIFCQNHWNFRWKSVFVGLFFVLEIKIYIDLGFEAPQKSKKSDALKIYCQNHWKYRWNSMKQCLQENSV